MCGILRIAEVLLLIILLPIGSEERGVLGFGSIPVAILPSCQDVKKTIALELHKHVYI